MPDIKSDLEKALNRENKGLQYLSKEELIKLVDALQNSYNDLYEILEGKIVDQIAFKEEN